MPQTLNLNAKGLVTSPNTLKAPLGSMITADNVTIDDDDVVTVRRGLSRERPLPGPTDRGRRQVFYSSTHLAAYDGGKMARWDDILEDWVDYVGTFNHPNSDRARLRFLEASGNLYATTATGVQVLDSPTGTWQALAVPRGLDSSGSLTGTSSWFTTDNQVAYRHIWVYKDANGNIRRGSPSGRLVLSNGTADNTNVSVTVTIPANITTSWFLQVYRSSLSGDVAVNPSDELFLCYEAKPTSGEITAGLMTFTDSQPSALLGQTLYTSASREGILQANEEPPMAWDFCLFKTCVLYMNCTSKHKLVVTLLSPPAVNDTITIGGITYTAKGTENIGSAHFETFSSGTAAQNITDTANSLIRVINRHASSTIYAVYQSGVTDAPGKMLFFERSIGGNSFAATSSAGSVYNPALPTSGTTVSSSNDMFKDAVMISKPGEPWAVPSGNIRRVRSANARSLRIMALRDAALVCKEDGISRITGTDPSNFTVDEHDEAKLLAPDSLVKSNNTALGLFDQGICKLSESGVGTIYRPIRGKILELNPTSDEVRFKTFGCAYESEGKYLLWTVSAATDDECTQAYVFNTFTKTFTRWPMQATSALVSPDDDRLYVFDGASSNIRIERKDRTYTDFYDAAYDTTITSSTGSQVFLSSTEFAEVGDALWVSDSEQARITAVSAAYVEVDSDITWTNGAAEIRKAIEAVVEYTPVTSGNPAVLCQYPEFEVFFRLRDFDLMNFEIASDRSTYYETVPLVGGGNGAWGLGAWGEGPWGGDPGDRPGRRFVPKNKQRASQLKMRWRIKEAYANVEILGISLPARSLNSSKVD